MEKHTPTPWKVTKLSHADDQLWLQITGPDGRGPIVRANSPGEPMADGVIAESKYLVTPEENQLANADFIVRACNSHDALLAACKLAQDQIIGMATWLKASGQSGIAKGAYKILDQLTSVIKESE